MANYKFERWKDKHGITLEEDFTKALERYAEELKKKRPQKFKGYLCPFGGQLAGGL